MIKIKAINKTLHPVIVTWVDSAVKSGWHYNDYKKINYSCTTVGNLEATLEDRLVLSLNQSAHGVGEVLEIPRAAVKSVRKLKL